ncbi:MAG: ribose 5-phosphate isomerase B [Clostridia bacterium]|nr:ribose 5-phosphate isomerase B [Clostridia bacterium]MCR5694551.1 ribose 5-phosphate isomerase B [Clostridia bacterium]
MKKYAIGSDHAGYEMRLSIKAYLESRGFSVDDFGTFDREKSNYPEIADVVANKVAGGGYDGGILICGTGVGMSLAANKVRGIRAACVSEPYSAKMSKEHNDANIICFGARVIGIETAKMIVDAWADSEFAGGRHKTRVDMITKLEKDGHL